MNIKIEQKAGESIKVILISKQLINKVRAEIKQILSLVKDIKKYISKESNSEFYAIEENIKVDFN